MDTLIKNLSAVLFDEVAIRTRIKELGFELSREYCGKNPILICILKGSIFFLSDLVRYMTIPIEIDFLSVSSYGDSSHTSGVVKIRKDIDSDITGRHVIVIEDIIDSGLSLQYITDYLLNHHPASVATAVLINKKCVRKVEIDVDYTGFEVEDDFLVGYGLDYAEQYRNLPYIGILKKEVYS
jgi:hypoxanthine phosphoribosyltransferase